MRERKSSAPTAVQSVAPSIAVLPFVDMSQEKNQEYFSDGLAEELLNDLAKIQGLRVVARTSSFQFKGKTQDLRAVGEQLNVGNILQGRYFYERLNKENLERAISYYEQAIKLDPGYAAAWAGLAYTRSDQAGWGYLPVQEGNREAREAAERALALDPNLGDAHAAMG